MRSKTALLVLAIVLAILQSGLHVASGDPLTTEVTLYAHTDPSATSAEGRVLTLAANSTSRQAADATSGVTFTLVPPLSAPLHMSGDLSAYVWLSSHSSVRGTVRVTVSEVTANASEIEIRSINVTLGLPSTQFQYIFGWVVDYTLATGSTLRLAVQCSPVQPVPVSVLWDDPSTRTRLVFRIEPSPRTSLTITDKISGRALTVFACNETGMTQLIMKVSVEDPFGGTNVRAISLTVTNSSGHTIIRDAPMTLTSRAELPLRLEYALPVAVPEGRFSVSASVHDYANRTFIATNEVVVTRFFRLTLLLVDAQKRPLSGLNVSFSTAAQLIEEETTDSDGTAVSLVPSSRLVGPITVQVRKTGLQMLSREVEVDSDSQLQIVVPWYDWTFLVRLQNVNLPISGARVELYLNGTLLASNSTDRNGLAVFTLMPAGTYDVTVVAPFASEQFQDVGHAPEPETTVIDFPFVSWTSIILLAAAVVIVASFGALVATRRRTETRRFKHVADLLGGVLPISRVIMIVGPSGTGKSLLLQNMLSDSLRLRRRCVYVSNSEMPSRIKEQLGKMGVDTERYEKDNMLRFIDAYSGGSGVVSSERHSVSSPRDLTALGIQITSCLEEVGGVGDVLLDSLAPIAALGDSTQAHNFVEYYGARVVKAGGNFVYVASDTIESDLLGRFEDSSDCVLQTERYAGPAKVRNRLLVKKARGIEHEQGWVGLKITSSGHMEFISLPSQST